MNFSGLQEHVWMARHPYLEDWPLMGSPWPTILLCMGYILFTKVIGPEVMANKKPMEIKKIMLAYNAAQVLLSAYIVYESRAAMGWLQVWPMVNMCQPVISGPKGYHGAIVTYIYFISNFTDWADTLFFVARKKLKHVSVLQLFHHAIMPLLTWSNSRFHPNYACAMIAQVNGVVHIFMYFYYFLAALGPRFGWLRFWKQGLTLLQIIQFVYAVAMLTNSLAKHPCELVPHVLVSANLIVIGTFLVLFVMFYHKEYAARVKKST